MPAAVELGGSTRGQERSSIELFGVPVDGLTMDETVEAARALVRGGGVHQHVAVNAAKLVEVQRNSALRDVIWTCDLVSADGQAVLWASGILGRPLPERVAGIDLFERLVDAAAQDGSSVYFLGAKDEVVQEAVAVMTERHPGLRIAGARDGYWQDDQEVVAAVRAARPDYLFLAIPSPRKEFWLKEHLESLGVPFVMGVGGSFDVVAGKVGRAPRWVQRAGFEWAWRLGQEPRRMWKRYLYTNTAFIWMVFKAWRRGR
jgi:N-acetylglucosaminyldiphosphoundecaprenol N-acetyl-beta-D-mannosaminyltransferase